MNILKQHEGRKPGWRMACACFSLETLLEYFLSFHVNFPTGSKEEQLKLTHSTSLRIFRISGERPFES
jgi:hypothetical protein